MRHTAWALGLLLAISTTAAGGCHRHSCVPTCEIRAKEVGCGNGGECKATCDKLHTSPVCLAEMKLFEKCFLEEPTAHWTCDEEGLPVVKNTFCVKERETVVACLQRAPAMVPPPSTK